MGRTRFQLILQVASYNVRYAMDGKWLTPGQLQAYPRKLGGMTVQTSYVGLWEVGGIKIERTRARNFFFLSEHENWQKSEYFGKFFGANLLSKHRLSLNKNGMFEHFPNSC